jgi:hypothetical protein
VPGEPTGSSGYGSLVPASAEKEEDILHAGIVSRSQKPPEFGLILHFEHRQGYADVALSATATGSTSTATPTIVPIIE